MVTQTPEPNAINIIDLSNSCKKNGGELTENASKNAASVELESCKKENSLGLYIFCYPRPDEFRFCPYLNSYIVWEAEQTL